MRQSTSKAVISRISTWLRARSRSNPWACLIVAVAACLRTAMEAFHQWQSLNSRWPLSLGLALHPSNIRKLRDPKSCKQMILKISWPHTVSITLTKLCGSKKSSKTKIEYRCILNPEIWVSQSTSLCFGNFSMSISVNISPRNFLAAAL